MQSIGVMNFDNVVVLLMGGPKACIENLGGSKLDEIICLGKGCSENCHFFYLLFKNSLPNLYGKSLHKRGQEFLDVLW